MLYIVNTEKLFRVQPLAKGVRLTAIFDSCYSGTCLDLPYTYTTDVRKTQTHDRIPANGLQGKEKVPKFVNDTVKAIIGSLFCLEFKKAWKECAYSRKAHKKRVRAHKQGREKKAAEADVIMFSGSKDSQTASVSHGMSPIAAARLTHLTTQKPNGRSRREARQCYDLRIYRGPLGTPSTSETQLY